MRRAFFHIHIWKTGGTTFLNICKNNFGKGFRRDIMLVQDWSLSTKQLRWLLGYHKWIRCYSSHMLSGDLPYDMEDTEVHGLSFVRNPVDRLISNYHYMMSSNYSGGFHKGMDFDEFYSRELRDDNPWYRNGQTYVLGGSATENGLSNIHRRLRKKCMTLLITERFDESCIALERLFPEDFKDCSYIPYNISSKRRTITEQQRNAVSQYMEFDFRLLKLANDRLDATLDRLFSNVHERQKAIDDFRRRCRLKRRRLRIVRVGNLLDRKIKISVKTMFRFLTGKE